MTTVLQEYQELLTLAQSFVLQEYSKEEWVNADRQNFQYFKETAQKQSKTEKKSVAPIQPVTPVTPVTPITPTVPTPPPPPPPSPPTKQNLQTVSEAKSIHKEGVTITTSKEIEIYINKVPTTADFFVPETLPKATPLDLEDIRKTITEKFPHQVLLQSPPNFASAMQFSDILIITLDTDPAYLDFLGKVSKAMKDRWGSASILKQSDMEAEGAWEKLISCPNLKLILINPKHLEKLPGLMQYHRTLKHRNFLSKIPYLHLEDVSAYLSDVKLKSILWKTICEQFPQ